MTPRAARRSLLTVCSMLLVLMVVVAACGDDNDADSSSTTAKPAAATTTVAADPTTTAPPATTTEAPPTSTTAVENDDTCGGAEALGGFLMDFANMNSPEEGIEFLITGVIVSAIDPSWGRGQVSAPPDSGVEGFVGIARCEDLGEGLAWSMRDAGTSGVGCMPEVPADLAHDC